jgi:hypothetical protein
MMFALALAGCGGSSGGSAGSAATTATASGATSASADPVSFEASQVSVAQSTAAVTVSVKRTGVIGQPASVNYSTSNGTAVAGTDYTATSGTLQWAENDATPKTVSVPVNHTQPFSGNRSFGIVLSDPSSATAIGNPGSSTVTITGEDTTGPGTLTLSDASYSVIQSAASLTVTVNRTGGSTGSVSVNYATTNGTAVAGTDYTATSGTVEWSDGDATSKTFVVPVSNATSFSGSKTFTITLSGPTSGAILGTPDSATATISGATAISTNVLQSVGSLQLSASGYSISQSAGALTVTVNRIGPSAGAMTVAYGTTPGSAVAGTDYTAASGTLSWGSGDLSSKTFSVNISNSTPFSGNKTFSVALSSPGEGATITSPGNATVTIVGDAAGSVGTVQLSANSYTVAQNAGSVAVTLTRIGGSTGAVGITYATTSGTAVAGTDFTSSFGTVQWADGDTSQKSFSIPVSAATLFSGTRSLTVTLSQPTGGAALGSPSTATVAITGSAAQAAGTLQLSASAYSVAQGAGTVAVTVDRTGGTSGAVSVEYATSNGTAVAGTNYTATSGTLQWADGAAQSQSFSIPISTTAFTGSQTLTVTLSGAAGASLGSPSSATVSIAGSGAATPATTGVFGIKASGSKLVSTLDGSTVQLIGANLSGLENGQSPSYWTAYANSTLAFWQSLANYQGSGINVIRLQLNSAYWLGYACGFSASTYQSTVEHVVSTANQAGLYVILDLHWDAPGTTCPIGQGGFPTTNATAFWKSLANTFKGNPAVIFELFNEPFGTGQPGDTEWGRFRGVAGPSDPILANGGNYSPFVAQNNVGGHNALTTTNITYAVAGEIQLLQTIRGEGATNLVLASTGGWDGAVNQWLNIYNTNGNPDPLKNFGATWHDYPGWTGGSSYALAIIAAGYPLVITETYGFDTNLNAVGNFTTGGAGLSEPAGYAFARAHNIGYVCGAQVNDWNGQTTLSLTATPPWSGCAAQ